MDSRDILSFYCKSCHNYFQILDSHFSPCEYFLCLSSGCEVSLSILQGNMVAGRGVGLASAAGTATVKRILDLSLESVPYLSAGQKGTVTLLDRCAAHFFKMLSTGDIFSWPS